MVDFKNFILGTADMKNKLVVRDSYVKMQDEIVKWLSNRDLPTGLFVVTRHRKVCVSCVRGSVFRRGE